MRKQFIIGNWKMNGQLKQVQTLLKELLTLLHEPTTTQCVILPPVIFLSLARDYLQESNIRWGAQNVYPKDNGPYTGEVSAPMLKDYGCSYVLVGHSERRQWFAENENFIAEKFHQVKEHAMMPILCVGETLAERQSGHTRQVLSKQLLSIADGKKDCFANCIIAYEPVWAIGSGQAAEPLQVQEIHQFIRALVNECEPANSTDLPVIYGGSLNEKNAAALLTMPDVDGGLIGGASLNAQQFADIVKCIN